MRNRILFSFLAWVAVIVSVQGKQKDFVLQSGRPVAIAWQRFGSTGGAYFAGLVVRDLQTVLSATAHIDTNTGNFHGRNDRTEQAD